MENLYTAFTDGGNRGGNPGRAAWGFVVYKDGAEIMRAGGYFELPQTNNHAEYSAVIELLKWWKAYRAFIPTAVLAISSDSEIIVNQINGSYAVGEKLRPLWAEAAALLHHTNSTIKHVYREFNKVADSIVNEYEDKHEAVLGIKTRKRSTRSARSFPPGIPNL